MEASDIIGYAAAVVVGFTLGLTGGGGSILTVPVLVYLVGLGPVVATAYSLFVVGTASLVGAATYLRRGLLSYRAAAVFAVPSLVAVYLTRRYLVPALPEVLFTGGGVTLTRDASIMLLFAVVMVLAAYAMIRPGGRAAEEADAPTLNYPLLMLQGAGVGVLTSIVGAGGGFLIVPALVLLARLPVKLAVGTSLLVIAANSLVGFAGGLGQTSVDWAFLLSFSALAVAGIVLGGWATRYVSAQKLKTGFGWFVLVMGAFILFQELT